ncbi:hypothetical protein AHAS_Ahas11G0251700 [Arachis hypogaea]
MAMALGYGTHVLGFYSILNFDKMDLGVCLKHDILSPFELDLEGVPPLAIVFLKNDRGKGHSSKSSKQVANEKNHQTPVILMIFDVLFLLN